MYRNRAMLVQLAMRCLLATAGLLVVYSEVI